jgi:hypothetical protein
MGFYCVYVSGFLLAVMVHHKFPIFGWIAFLSGSMFGGIASGVVWTAQGRYFSLNAQQYFAEVVHLGVKEEKVANRFAGLFACIFLGVECFLRAFASVLFLGIEALPGLTCCLFYCQQLYIFLRSFLHSLIDVLFVFSTTICGDL